MILMNWPFVPRSAPKRGKKTNLADQPDGTPPPVPETTEPENTAAGGAANPDGEGGGSIKPPDYRQV
jgi:hypothetical protein